MDECSIAFASTEAEIAACFAVMQLLRPHLVEHEFVAQVYEQAARNRYQLVRLEHQGKVLAVAGFRVGQCLAWGKYLYVDDLVTDAEVRSQGYGDRLFQWLVDYGQREGCSQLHLDSGVQRFAAHRFYHRQGMTISSHHFVLPLSGHDS